MYYVLCTWPHMSSQNAVRAPENFPVLNGPQAIMILNALRAQGLEAAAGSSVISRTFAKMPNLMVEEEQVIYPKRYSIDVPLSKSSEKSSEFLLGYWMPWCWRYLPRIPRTLATIRRLFFLGICWNWLPPEFGPLRGVPLLGLQESLECEQALRRGS